MNHRVFDLTHTIVNNGGAPYKHRLYIARLEPKMPRAALQLWTRVVTDAAFEYEQKFQPDERFTFEELHATVMELSRYYRQHLSEI